MPKSITETISAFANTRGGYILLGLDEATGFAPVKADAKALADSLVSRCQDHLEPPVQLEIEVRHFEGSAIVAAWIPPASPMSRPVFVKAKGVQNGAFKRLHDGDHRLSPMEIHALEQQAERPDSDRAIVKATIDDLDETALQGFLARARKNRHKLAQFPDDEVLRMTGVLVDHNGETRVTLAGLLAFGRFPQRAYPQLSVTFVAWPTRTGEPLADGTRFLDNVTIEGTVPEMIEEGVRVIRKNLTRRAVIQGTGREDQLEYPEPALREALANALMHRDYHALAHGTQVQVNLYPDRIEVTNPGGLFGSVIDSDLFVHPVSSSRNQTLAKILEDVPLPQRDETVSENRGSGLLAMAAGLRAAGLEVPEFEATLTSCRLVIRNQQLFDQGTLSWLAQVGDANLSDAQRLALAHSRHYGRVSNRDLRKLCGLDAPAALQVLSELANAGLLEKRGDRRWTTWHLVESSVSPTQPLASAPGTGLERESRRSKVVALLQTQTLSAREIAEKLDVGRQTANGLLRELRRDGLVEMTTAKSTSKNTRWRAV